MIACTHMYTSSGTAHTCTYQVAQHTHVHIKWHSTHMYTSSGTAHTCTHQVAQHTHVHIKWHSTHMYTSSGTAHTCTHQVAQHTHVHIKWHSTHMCTSSGTAHTCTHQVAQHTQVHIKWHMHIDRTSHKNKDAQQMKCLKVGPLGTYIVLHQVTKLTLIHSSLSSFGVRRGFPVHLKLKAKLRLSVGVLLY